MPCPYVVLNVYIETDEILVHDVGDVREGSESGSGFFHRNIYVFCVEVGTRSSRKPLIPLPPGEGLGEGVEIWLRPGRIRKNNMSFRESLVGYSLLRTRATSGCPELTVESVGMEGEGFRIACERPAVAVGPVRVLLLGRIHELHTDEFVLSSYHGRQEGLVAALYERHDIDFRSLVDGHFFIVLHDEKRGRLWLVNNRYRATNLYYYEHDGGLYFANSVRLLLQNLPIRPELDPRGIPSFLGTGFSYAEKTHFKGMYRLLPTFALCIEGGTFRLSHHWDEQFRFDRQPFEDLESHLDRYEELFERSILNHIEQFSPDELGCMLSGGHDTSYTFINATKAFGKPVHGFTAAFEGFGFDEYPKARFVADKFDGVCHPVSVGPKDFDLIPSMVRAVEEPVSGGSLPIYACAREAARMGMSSVLAGDAGDTLWGEYYPVAEWHTYIQHLPLFARKILHRLVRSGSEAFDLERLWEQALLRHLPKRFVYSVQQSLDVPFHALFNKRPEILDCLLLRLKRRGWYNAYFLDLLFDEFPRQKVKPNEIVELKLHGYRIYSLLTLEVWCMEFLDGSPRDPGEEAPPLEEYLA